MATEKRLIDANALGRDTFHVMCEGEYGEPCERCVVDWDDIETAPTVDAVEVVHGRWLSLEEYAEKIGADATKAEYPGAWVFCSECGQQMRSINGWYYCPNCGAKMDGDGNG